MSKLKIFSRTTGPISSKLGTKHPWEIGIQGIFPRGDTYVIVKIHCTGTTGPIYTEIGEVDSNLFKLEPFNSQKEDNEVFFRFLINALIYSYYHMC